MLLLSVNKKKLPQPNPNNNDIKGLAFLERESIRVVCLLMAGRRNERDHRYATKNGFLFIVLVPLRHLLPLNPNANIYWSIVKLKKNKKNLMVYYIYTSKYYDNNDDLRPDHGHPLEMENYRNYKMYSNICHSF
jgi:hypothetical protein